MELSEAIEKAKDFIKEVNDNTSEETPTIVWDRDVKWIDTVLEELEKHKEHENQYMNAEIFSAKQLKAIEKDYIHKDKIREKIEERKKQLEETSKRREKAKEQEEQAVLWCIEIRLDERIKTCEELLKGE